MKTKPRVIIIKQTGVGSSKCQQSATLRRISVNTFSFVRLILPHGRERRLIFDTKNTIVMTRDPLSACDWSLLALENFYQSDALRESLSSLRHRYAMFWARLSLVSSLNSYAKPFIYSFCQLISFSSLAVSE